MTTTAPVTSAVRCTRLDAQCGVCRPLLLHALAAMPEDGATRSRDYGRGYAQAVRDVMALLDYDPYSA